MMPITMLMMVSSVIGISQNIPGQQLTKQMYHQKMVKFHRSLQSPKNKYHFFVQPHNQT